MKDTQSELSYNQQRLKSEAVIKNNKKEEEEPGWVTSTLLTRQGTPET